MTEESAIIKVDVRGEVCPSPLIKAMEAMKNADDDQSVEIATDFSPAVLAISNAALKNEWDIEIKSVGSNSWKVLLTRSKSI
jgi:TusA-related sulfurtransferase